MSSEAQSICKLPIELCDVADLSCYLETKRDAIRREKYQNKPIGTTLKCVSQNVSMNVH